MNLVGWEEALLFLVGVILVIIEIFFIPGFGVPGVLGLICVITALVLSLGVYLERDGQQLAHALRFGIGFTLGYDYDSFPEGGADVAKGIHSGTLGVNYTGREDFHFGLETQLSTLKQTDVESTLAATKFVINLRYYF